MKYGLSEKQLGEIIDFIAQYPEVETAVLFGSRALGTYKEASDVDIALLGEKVNHSLAAKMKFNIEEDTYLPFMFDFVAYPTITNDALRKHIDAKGVVIFRRGESEWKETTLGEQINLKRGYDLPSKSRVDGLVPIYSSSGVSGYHNKKMADDQGVITGRYGTIGKVYFVKGPYWPLNTTLYVQSFKGNEPKFIYYLLQQFDWEKFSDKSAVPGVNRNDVHQEQLVFPPLPEQKAIASVLSSLDDKIDLLHRQNKTLEAMAETLFRQWFVEETQADWEEGRLGDVIELHYGKGLKTEERAGSGYPVVGSSGIIDHHTEFLVKGPGIVIGRKGTLGKVIYLWDNFHPIDTTYYVKSKVESAGLLYEYFLLKTIGFEDMNTDSAVPGLNRDIALSTEIKIPPEDKLHAFNKLVADFVGKLKTNREQIRTLGKLRDTLLPKLMSGEVRVAV